MPVPAGPSTGVRAGAAASAVSAARRSSGRSGQSGQGPAAVSRGAAPARSKWTATTRRARHSPRISASAQASDSSAPVARLRQSASRARALSRWMA